jgi:hypothetical protein
VYRRRSNLACILLLAVAAAAHPGEPCLWRFRFEDGSVTSRLVVPLAYLTTVPDLDRDRDGRLAPEELRARRGAVEELLLRHFVLRSGRDPVQTAVRDLRVDGASVVELDLLHRVPEGTADLEAESTFFELTGPGHFTACRVEEGGRMQAFALSVENPAQRIETAAGRRGRERTGVLVTTLAAAALAGIILVNRRTGRHGAPSRRTFDGAASESRPRRAPTEGSGVEEGPWPGH